MGRSLSISSLATLLFPDDYFRHAMEMHAVPRGDSVLVYHNVTRSNVELQSIVTRAIKIKKQNRQQAE